MLGVPDGGGEIIVIDHTSQLSPIFGRLLDEGILTDVELVFDPVSESLRAHRAVLAAWCKPFKAMFTNGMRESCEWRVVLREVDPSAMRSLLQYLYTGNVRISQGLVLPLLAVANRFEVITLKECCEEYIMRQLAVVNCCELCVAAERHACERLQSLAIDFVVQNFEKVYATNGFGILSVGMLRTILSRDDLSVRSEEIVFDAMSRWVECRGQNEIDPAKFDEILEVIRFPLMSSEYLSNVVERCQVVNQSTVMSDLMFEAYRFHAVGAAINNPATTQLGKSRIKERGACHPTRVQLPALFPF